MHAVIFGLQMQQNLVDMSLVIKNDRSGRGELTILALSKTS